MYPKKWPKPSGEAEDRAWKEFVRIIEANGGGLDDAMRLAAQCADVHEALERARKAAAGAAQARAEEKP